jgi:hypothetical protein
VRVATDNNEIEAWTLQRVISSAMALADSGRYHDFTDIDYALRFERGWPQARALIDEPAMRMALNRRCADAREASLALAVQPEPPSPEPLQVEAPEVVERARPSVIGHVLSLAAGLMPSAARWRPGRTA